MVAIHLIAGDGAVWWTARWTV